MCLPPVGAGGDTWPPREAGGEAWCGLSPRLEREMRHEFAPQLEMSGRRELDFLL